ncbi:uncharacterized protein TRUGW13939_03773 [Talaromyces rugulosus]|uniref:J domain-containing protein n=1 Tax=Talaromyces rugulosus TaxID=121627 RepID=A0A7H8QRQ2_TALRU|nr:uncharacterized protein TRUGW13939_03773 [Talaromyces rugulosus]QKX56667.1 hypothetical protein TRUGW13939_03773 [Talaromyces rugulosus]
MATNLPSFDPYQVLGVDKQSSAAEVKLAYRKLILKCHPDKIQDDALRAKASDEFQKVQESYEILTDETRRRLHDQAVRLAALRKEVNSHNAARSAASSREYRDGRMYEERVPADAAFFTDSDEFRYTEEPPTYSKKYSESTKRAHTKVTEEKKKTKSVPISSPRTPKQADREYVKTKNQDRAKHRTKERRRDASDKYERTSYTGDDFSDPEEEIVYNYTVKVTTDSRASPRESAPRRSKTDPSTSRRRRRRHIDSETESEGEDYGSDNYAYAQEYIHRTKEPVPELDRRYRPSRTHSSYEGARYERESPRYSSRGYSRDEDIRHPASSPHRTSRRSHDRLSSPARGYERSTTTTSASPPKVSSSRAPPPVSRSSTAPHPRPRREGLIRSESNGMSTLTSMVAGIAMDGVLPGKSRTRKTERNDSGYSSGPGTPEVLQGSNSVPKVSRFKIVEPSDREPETIIREPAEARYRSTSPLSKSERERSSRTKSSRSHVYDPVYEPEIRMARPAATSKSSYSRPLYGEVRYSPDVSLDGRRPSRRQAAY